MSWRTIIVSNKCKLSYKNNYLIIRNEEIQMVHLSEINIVVIDSTQVSITTYLISELSKRKIKVIFCDELRNPTAELVPYYGAHNTSKKVLNQIKWKDDVKDRVWKKIVTNKIYQQHTVLKLFKIDGNEKLLQYIEEIKDGDVTNREGHAAKVYFNLLFGNDFSRNSECDINSALDYGYAILLSTFNKEVVSKGYITQLGVNHKNEFNFFNFSCDLMEPFRPIVDAVVYNSIGQSFDEAYKYKLINILNLKIKIDGKEQYVANAIPIYVKSVIDAIEQEQPELVLNYEL